MARMNRDRRLRLLTAALCLILGLAAVGMRSRAAGSLAAQTAADRWAPQGGWKQLTVLYTDGAGPDEMTALQARSTIQSALASDGLETAEVPMALSRQLTLTVTAGDRSATARVVAVSGDWFTLHAPEMVSGWYFSDNDAGDDLVIPDRTLAWSLFGGTDLTGLTMSVGGQTCAIAGVAELPTGSEAEEYGSEGTLWISWGLLSRLTDAPTATCVEALLPEPVADYAATALNKALSPPEGKSLLIDNTDRYTLAASLRALTHQGTADRGSGITVPWWEYAARTQESRVAAWTLAACLLLTWPTGYALYKLIRLARRAKRRLDTEIKRRRS